MGDNILSVVYLLLVLALILPGFIYINRPKKTFFNNLILWLGIIIITVIVYFILV